MYYRPQKAIHIISAVARTSVNVYAFSKKYIFTLTWQDFLVGTFGFTNV